MDLALAGAATRLEATYHYPYQMHASVGTACAVADVDVSRATVWSATQAVHPLKHTLAMVLGLDADDIRVIFRMGAGCYGINGADTVSYDAALFSQAVGRPVGPARPTGRNGVGELRQRVRDRPAGRLEDQRRWYTGKTRPAVRNHPRRS